MGWRRERKGGKERGWEKKNERRREGRGSKRKRKRKLVNSKERKILRCQKEETTKQVIKPIVAQG